MTPGRFPRQPPSGLAYDRPVTQMPRRLVAITVLVASLSLRAAAQTSPQQLEVLRAAAAKGSAPAQYALGATAEKAGDLDGALRWYRQSANAGYAGAQYSLALMLDAGIGTAPDPLEAERLLQKAAAANFEPAMQRLVLMEAARAEASKSTSPAALAAMPSAAASTEAGSFINLWAIAVALLALGAAAFFWTRSHRVSATTELEKPRARNRRR